MNRSAWIAKAQNESFDVCIIGGGITGAGILAHAIQRGWKTLLIDKQDFASGTSSRSSKMIHGGLRYLKMMKLGMVYEALHEREHLFRTYPGLVKPLPFIMPVYHSSFFLAVMALFIRLYGKLAGRSVLSRSQKLAAEEVGKYLPGINHNKLKGGILYWDGWVNDALLAIQSIKESYQKGAVVLNYCEAKKFVYQDGLVQSMECTDNTDGQNFSVNAQVYINATGVWTDEVLERASGKHQPVMKPSKGVHVMVPAAKIPSDYVALVQSGADDKRYVYSFPWEHGLTVLGTTDTEYSGNPEKAVAQQDDINYLFNSFNKNFPSAKLTINDIVGVYTGLRPMLDDNHNKGSYLRSREYRIWWSSSNFLNIAGGKLTSFLSMGKKCMDVTEKCLNRKNIPDVDVHSNKSEVIHEDYYKEENASDEILINGFNLTGAEIMHHIRFTFAQELSDVLTRRTSITYAMKNFDENGVRKVAEIMAEALAKNSEWADMQVAKYRRHWEEYHPDFL
ncbi:MAG TPA: glycerol-3-phosphate dehydrogenase/oxidase [Bacteroidales bacterium]|nr:glycerol-3-phosphate dehydrogenase/oxidase [Bacteroidales bacterium]